MNNGVLKGLITIKDIEKVIEFPNSAKDKQGRLLSWCSCWCNKRYNETC